MNSNSSARVPVTVITGFLGAGKTTLLNRILRGGHELRVGVLVNDFGDINIDARLVESMDGQAIDLSNGCVCCTMQGDLVTSVQKMLSRPNPPGHIVVEASGISDPIGVLAAFQAPTLRTHACLEAVVVVLDAENARDPHLDSELVINQIRAADIVVLNKIDLVSDRVQTDLHAWIEQISPEARILPAAHAAVNVEAVLGLGSARLIQTDGAISSHTDNFESWSYSCDRPLAYRRVREALVTLDRGVLRAKGFLHLADAPNLRFVAHKVGGRLSVDVHGPWRDEKPRTQLVLIGQRGSTTTQELTVRLNACRTLTIPLLAAYNFQQLRARGRGACIPPSLGTEIDV